MKPADMLHQMCHEVLPATDVKALCKARGFPPQAVSSRGVLETLFLSPKGLHDAFNSLDSKEIALLHLLAHRGDPVDVAFFGRVYGAKHSYGGTFTQRFHACFAKVKQRLVRKGVLLWAEAPESILLKTSRMERWRFALPAEFHGHLPPLIRSPRAFDGDGDWRPNAGRDTLCAQVGAPPKDPGNEGFQIEADELRLNGKRFNAARLARWQQAGWRQAIQDETKAGTGGSYSKPPDEAILCILLELGEGSWADAEWLAEPLRVFCGQKMDVPTVCGAGWEWGMLARHVADGTTWYRPAPKQPHVAPHKYLIPNEQDASVAADLTTIPFDALEQIVAISDQRVNPAGNNTLLLTPNFIKLGRAEDDLLAAEAVQWLVAHSPPFAQAFANLRARRGKTILHDNVAIARVSDLSLKVAIEKALGTNLVALENDFIAFPPGSLDDVRRVVKQSGHVVKEVAAE